MTSSTEQRKSAKTLSALYGVQGVVGSNPAVPTEEMACRGRRNRSGSLDHGTPGKTGHSPLLYEPTCAPVGR